MDWILHIGKDHQVKWNGEPPMYFNKALPVANPYFHPIDTEPVISDIEYGQVTYQLKTINRLTHHAYYVLKED